MPPALSRAAPRLDPFPVEETSYRTAAAAPRLDPFPAGETSYRTAAAAHPARKLPVRRNLAVRLSSIPATSPGAPAAMIRPPSLPPPGPMSTM